MFLGHESKESVHNAETARVLFTRSFMQLCNAFSSLNFKKGLFMKRCLAIFLAAFMAITFVTPQTAKAVAASFGFGMRINSIADFNSPLRPFGSWSTLRTFGRVWRPTRVAVGWRPYSKGQWVWTSAGWFWQS